MALKCSQLLAGLGIPKSGRFVIASRADAAAIGSAFDTVNRALVAAQCGTLALGCHFPDFYCPVRASRHDALSVQTERYAGDRIAMAPERSKLLARLGVPYRDCAI